MSSPDAVAVARSRGGCTCAKHLMTVLEGERLENAATGLVLLRFAPTALAAGSFLLPEAAAAERVKVVAVGLANGWAMFRLQRRLDDDAWQVTLSLLAPFAAHRLSVRLHSSGKLAVEACGILLGARFPMQLALRSCSDQAGHAPSLSQARVRSLVAFAKCRTL